MSAKPTSVPRWADVGGDIVEPTSGKKDIGWVFNEEPPAQYFNWLLNLTYQWLQYLSDGVLDGNFQFLDAVDIDGDLNVDGAATFGSVDIGALTVVSVSASDYVETTEGDVRHGSVQITYPLQFFY